VSEIPRISVVIPVYNERDTLEEILCRVHAVDLDKEIVLVDDFSTDGDLAGRPGVVGLTALDDGLIRIARDRLGRDADFVLAHELVHSLLGPTWDPLPAILMEGLCDTVAARVAPESAASVRAIRLFDVAFAVPGMSLELSFFEPGPAARSQVRFPVADGDGPRPDRALRIRGRGISLHAGLDDENALYGFGLLVTERIVARIGLEGLHGLCLRARAEGHDVVPGPWILAAARMGAEPATWRDALLDAMREAELAALCDVLAGQLASCIVGALRDRFPSLDGRAFLERTLPTIGWEASGRRVAVGTVEPLREGILARWSLTGPATLRPGEGWWLRDRDGLHLTTILEPEAEGDPYTLSRLWLGEGSAHGGGLTPLLPSAADARVEAYLRVGRDEAGVYLSSSMPGPFERFRVELDGFVVADLSRGRNAEVDRDEHGWWMVTCRMPEELDPSGLVVHHPDANVVVSQRMARSASDAGWHVALRLPYGP